jgi:hypothetical protein
VRDDKQNFERTGKKTDHVEILQEVFNDSETSLKINEPYGAKFVVENLVVAHLVKKLLAFYETPMFITCPQDPATCSYPEHTLTALCCRLTYVCAVPVPSFQIFQPGICVQC